MITEIYNNVFYSFWTFAGTTILVYSVTVAVTGILAILVRK